MSLLRYQLEHRLGSVTGLPPDAVDRVAREVLDIFGQTMDEFIAARHSDLQREGYSTAAIYKQIQDDLGEWRFRARALSQRQIRRRIYG